ncbi:hypothetical protein DICVIV_04889 [Dictyocaulus viviparus]|uniref:SF4 helicase domain-containing protein n=1 Tax=Dictyocaulus viviparus TaxID=29172 RepID=A0A0D8XWV0_DICVI|nr:hypothetical protein DICVIV_04889 [Dictyocaulus viviparus]
MDDYLIFPDPNDVPVIDSDPDFSPSEGGWAEWFRSSYRRAGSAGSTPSRLYFYLFSSEAPSPRLLEQGGIMPPAQPDPHIKYLWNESVDISEMSGMEQNDMLQLRIMLGIERISTETLSRYNVRGHMDSYDQPAVLYPRYRGLASRTRIPVGLKVIRKIGDRMEKENYPLPDDTLPKPRFSGIFGYHMTTASDRAVVLTTNERDTLAIYEATDGALAFALPQGERLDSNVRKLVNLKCFVMYFLILKILSRFFLWFPPRHLDFAKEWGYALNGARCYLIRNAERPIELVRNGKNKEVKHIISREAVRLREKGFRSMTDIREEVKADLINSSTRQLGLAQWKRFSPLNKYLLGLRPGELTVLTGGTGFGKTTFLCEYALDLFTQGVRTLFCSFEMPEEKILKWMLVQYAGVPLYRVEYSSAIDMWLDKFERTKGPLTIMKADEFREKTINQIASAIRSQVVNSGCQHVVIDNLQFLVNQSTMGDDQSSSLERFHMQDRFVGHMRAMATQYGVHVTMVVHPRKTDADTDLDIQHFGGSARVTQEADNVLALQRRRDERDRGKFRKFLYVYSENRYGGRKVETDQLEMLFQPGTYSHTIVDHSQKI